MPKNKPVVVSHTDHPAAFKKVRCPSCQSYAIADPHNDHVFKCGGCGRTFKDTKF
jgi:ribosomal protein S27E